MLLYIWQIIVLCRLVYMLTYSVIPRLCAVGFGGLLSERWDQTDLYRVLQPSWQQ